MGVVQHTMEPRANVQISLQRKTLKEINNHVGVTIMDLVGLGNAKMQSPHPKISSIQMLNAIYFYQVA